MLPLAFIDQPQGKIQGKADKKRVRQHAMNHSVTSRSGGRQTKKRGELVELEVPEGFGESGVVEFGDDNGGRELVQIDDTDDIEAATGRLMDVVVGMDRRSGEGESSGSGVSGFVAGGSQLVFDAGTSSSRALKPLAPKAIEGSMTSSDTSKMRSRGRVFAPKVRTGCLACKQRRIKCDETKPSCQRCIQYYGSCSGYAPQSQPKPNSTLRPIVRRPSATVERPLTLLEFENDTSSAYFRIYREETSVEVTGIFASSFWTQIILQEAHRQPFVLKAVSAIGALSKATKAEHWASLLPMRSEMLLAEAKSHRESALSIYASALRHMRTLAATTEHELRRIVISSLLVFAFETFYGSPDVAFSHALIGDRLICNWLLKIGHNSGVSSPEPNDLEDDILRAFMRVDLHMMTFTDVRASKTHRLGKKDGQSSIDTMPLCFQDINEAKLYWELIMRRSCHFAYDSFRTSQSIRLQREFHTSTPNRGVEMVSGNTIYSSPYSVPQELISESQIFLSEITRFERAFSSLYTHVQASGNTIDYICAACLRMHYLATKIMVAGTVFTSEMEYDVFLPEFEEILVVSRYLTGTCLDYKNCEPKFGLDLGVVSPAFLVMLRCRDRRVRREVCGVLFSNPNREGPWDRTMMAQAGKWIMEIEERGLDGEAPIPEENRVRLSRVMIDMERRRMVLQCVRRSGLDGGVLEWEEGVVELE
ncbi:Zn2/Cys6 DNA-binding protein [Glarea lozoyensis ATCC 20868]|uniref:Zn2/Cys6 DNA-binding protein n=1 Tax=Glarea lozoyensis (strain ATCC 20868 / MF5171) TaxID=1116229 RepID=S3E2I3_GLAL2|nr:Zn2/Cys6 DNA-binding protein [Glarea lozoyensis ATCC 20868]EPE32673.1 Zn2/Cys6 DNA-binding protein [Glarea lozoyensis ATCC 20868]